MECLGIGLLVAVPIFLLGGAIVGIVAFRRTEALAARLRAIESRLDTIAKLATRAAIETRGEPAAVPSSVVDLAPVSPAPTPTPPPPPVAVSPSLPPPGVPEPVRLLPPQLPLPPESRPPLPPLPDPAIDWEAWFGIKGAAVLGGLALALAGLLFVKYAVEHGLLSPTARVTIGLIAGVAVLLASEWMRTRYQATANALAGAGIVILYGAIWAAGMLYHLVGNVAAFGFMVLVTLVAGLLAHRRRSLVVATLGLFGGFATPLLLATGWTNPIGLFGYVLLLDAGLAFLARRHGFRPLIGLAGAATLLIQAIWVFGHARPEDFLLGLVLIGAMALISAIGWRFADAESARLGSLAGLLPAFAFAFYFAVRSTFSEHLWPLGALVAILSIAAIAITRQGGHEWLGRSAVAAGLGVFLGFLLREPLDLRRAWEVTAVLALWAGLIHVFVEIDRRQMRRSAFAGPESLTEGALAPFGGLLLLLLGSLSSPADTAWPWLAGCSALALVLLRQSAVPDQLHLAIVAATGIGLEIMLTLSRETGALEHRTAYLGASLAIASGLRAHAHLRQPGARRAAENAAFVFSVIVLPALGPASARALISAPLFGLTLIALLVFGALAAARLVSGERLCLIVAVAAAAATWRAGLLVPSMAEARFGLLDGALSIATVIACGLATGARMRAELWSWRAVALAGPLWFIVLHRHWTTAFGDAAIGLLPVLLAAIALGIVAIARRRVETDSVRIGALAWSAAVALGFVSIAIPLQLDREWITIGWAIEGFLVTQLWRRLRHDGLLGFALALEAAVVARLVANPELLRYHPRGELPVLNWLAYTYLVPAAALIGTTLALERAEAPTPHWLPNNLARFPGGGAILVIFVWINLAVVDAFSTGEWLVFALPRESGRDLTLSLVWGVYALILLGIGFWRDQLALRWVSLCVLVLTIAKVFLYDLGELEDLYRVASLVGLAISLTLVSLAYQRMGLRKR